MGEWELLEGRIQYSRAIFDAIPSPAFIVDEDVRIYDFNTAAEALLGLEPATGVKRRGGEALGCLYAVAAGCGMADVCRGCTIRNGVRKALAGTPVFREQHCAELNGARLDLLVTASLLPYTEFPQVLLILENVTDLCRKRRVTNRGRLNGSPSDARKIRKT